MPVNWHVVGIHLIALEMKKQVVYELLFVSVAKERHERFAGYLIRMVLTVRC